MPLGGGATVCSNNLAAVMNASQGTVTERDGGFDVLVSWSPDAGLPEPYLDMTSVETIDRAVMVNRRIMSPSSIEVGVQLLGSQDAGVEFLLVFADPDRNGLPGCTGSHGGMEDNVVLAVTVSPIGDGGVREVSTSASVSLGAF